VALKLAQFEFIYLIKGFKPILLLDDIFDKLDRSRVEKLMELVSHERFGQIIITDTNIERVNFIFKEINKAIQIFSINKGKIE
ncbi:MAG: DNA replication and repair protein RecF, partial [Bacteroidales bacterium]|nr:DNA replication and repair protein RecF [Bacteroidales bacterium]